MRRNYSCADPYLVGICGYALGLLLSALFDLPTGALIVWTLATCGLLAQVFVRAGVPRG